MSECSGAFLGAVNEKLYLLIEMNRISPHLAMKQLNTANIYIAKHHSDNIERVTFNCPSSGHGATTGDGIRQRQRE